MDSALFAHVLPFCLEAWREDLCGTNSGYGGFVEHFYPVLAGRHVFDEHLTAKQGAAVAGFMRESILDEIDGQRGLAFQGMMSRPYRWFRALTTYGVLLPDVERLWTEWWSLSTVGRAGRCGAVRLLPDVRGRREPNIRAVDARPRRWTSLPLGLRRTFVQPSLVGNKCRVPKARSHGARSE